MTLDNDQMAFTHTQCLAEQSYKFFIGFTFDRRGGYPYLQHSAGKANQLTLAGIGVNSQRKFDLVLWHVLKRG